MSQPQVQRERICVAVASPIGSGNNRRVAWAALVHPLLYHPEALVAISILAIVVCATRKYS